MKDGEQLSLFEQARQITQIWRSKLPPETIVIAVYKLPENHKPFTKADAKPEITVAELAATRQITTTQGRRKAFLYCVKRKKQKLEDFTKK